MLVRVALSVLVLSEVNAHELGQAAWSDINHTRIHLNEYCGDKQCLAKCCPKGQILMKRSSGASGASGASGVLIQCTAPELDLEQKIKYSNINVYQWNETSGEAIDTNRTISSHFYFVLNNVFSNPNSLFYYPPCNFSILEDGTIKAKPRIQVPSNVCDSPNKLEYCVEYYVSKNYTRVKFIYRVLSKIDPEGSQKDYFAAGAMLTSAFFIMLVLVVYGLLPTLRKFVGKILMAFLLTFSIQYILRSARIFSLFAKILDTKGCQYLSPVVYYFTVSSFCWLNVMSLDVWYTTRGIRKVYVSQQARGESTRLSLYCAYAWGAPVPLTLTLVALDRLDSDTHLDVPVPFKSCSATFVSTQYYTHIPIGIMTIANCIFFTMIAYNIWSTKKALTKSAGSTNNNTGGHRFAVYLKIFILTGVGWLLELAPDMKFVYFVIVNFVNLLIGVAIFIIFVCKKDVILLLCNRLNIRNRCVDRLRASLTSRSTTTSITNSTSRIIHKYQKKQEESTETQDLNNKITQQVA